jgi:hypothetical protein
LAVNAFGLTGATSAAYRAYEQSILAVESATNRPRSVAGQ